MSLDVRDTEYVWCKGTVMDILINKKHAPTLFIHYEVPNILFSRQFTSAGVKSTTSTSAQTRKGWQSSAHTQAAQVTFLASGKRKCFRVDIPRYEFQNTIFPPIPLRTLDLTGIASASQQVNEILPAESRMIEPSVSMEQLTQRMLLSEDSIVETVHNLPTNFQMSQSQFTDSQIGTRAPPPLAVSNSYPPQSQADESSNTSPPSLSQTASGPPAFPPPLGFSLSQPHFGRSVRTSSNAIFNEIENLMNSLLAAYRVRQFMRRSNVQSNSNSPPQ
jgi:hypothetical protein